MTKDETIRAIEHGSIDVGNISRWPSGRLTVHGSVFIRNEVRHYATKDRGCVHDGKLRRVRNEGLEADKNALQSIL